MRREEEGAGHRHQRVQGLILEELRALLRDDVSDPALASVRIAAVVLSVDYRHARVHFTLAGSSTPPKPPNGPRVVARSGADEARGVERALARATPFLRARLAEAIDMKRLPELRFVFDGVDVAGEGDPA